MIANFHDPLLDAAKWARRTVVLIGLSVVALCAVAQEPADSTGVAEEADTIKYSVKLGDVEVKASNLTRRGGKDVYVVTDDMKRGLYNAGQLLSRVNGVVYNPITTDITYLGSKNVVILLDSVPKPADYIKRLSPDRFDRIDVINFPTGKYLGYDVLINYHSRPTYKGYESNLFSQAYALPGNKLGHGKWLQRNDAYADFTYTNGKWNIAAWMSDKWNRSAGQSGYANHYTANHFKESTVTTGRHAPTTLSRTNEMPGFLAVDYEINKLQSVSVQWSFAGEDWSTRNDYRLATENTLTHATDTIDYRTRSHTHGAWRNTFGAYYRGRFGAWSLNASATYTNHRRDNYRSYSRSDGYSLNDDRRNAFNYVGAAVDASRFIGQSWSVSLSETFYALNVKDRRLESDALLSDNSTIYNFFYGQVYFQPKRSLSLSALVGLTAYHNESGGLRLTRLEPRINASMFWNPSATTALRVNYSLTPSMPGVSLTNGYGQLADSLNYVTGNPHLVPSRIHNAAVSLTLFNALTLRANYTHIADDIFDIETLGDYAGRPVVWSRPENARSDRLVLGLNFNKELPRGFEITINANAEYVNASYHQWHRRRWSPRGNVQLSYWNPKLFYAIFDYSIISSAQARPQSLSWGHYEVSSVSLQRTFFNRRLQVMVMYAIPLHFIKDDRIKSEGRSDALEQSRWIEKTYYTDNLISVSIAYRFAGGNKVRKYNRPTMNL